MKKLLVCCSSLLWISGCSFLPNQSFPWSSQDNAEQLENGISVTAADEINPPLALPVADPDLMEAAPTVDQDSLIDELGTPHRQTAPGEDSQQESVEMLVVYDSVWDRVRAGLQFEVKDDPRVEAERNWYLRHPSYLSRVAKRSQPYLHFIVESLEERNLPVDLALLPIVESAFDPFAYSHGRASGMWQFIPGTGKRFGLDQNWWYDGRRDVYASTIAAMDYLEYLHGLFDGDWMHALAAYNSGEGNVRKAIRKNKKRGKDTSFWSLDLPRETRAYVPKLLALADILRNSEEYKVTWEPVANQPYFAKVDIDAQMDLAMAAEFAGIEINEFYRLNPGFNRWATAPTGPNYVLLPVANVDAFNLKLAETPADQRLSWKRYIIQSGDSLITIAKKHNTTVELLKSVNNIDGTMIRAGKPLMIPVASAGKHSYTKSADQRLASLQSRTRSGTKLEHQVQAGDSFWKIAQKYNVNVRSLAKWNGMAPTDTLKVGQKLVVWTKSASAAATKQPLVADRTTRKIHYKVRRGDSLDRIARKFKVSVADLVSWNNLNVKKYLQPGQSLRLIVDVTRQY